MCHARQVGEREAASRRALHRLGKWALVPLFLAVAACSELERETAGVEVRAADFDRLLAAWSLTFERFAGTPLEFRAVLGKAQLPDAGFVVEGFEVTGTAAPLAAKAHAEFRVASLRDTLKPVRVTPIAASGAADLDGANVEFSARVRGAAQALDLTLSGKHQLETGVGRARLRLSPLEFRKGGLQPDSLAPGAGGLVDSLDGRVEAHGSVTWRGAELGGEIDVALRDVTVVTEAVTVERINAVVKFSPPWPLQTPAGQTLAMARVDLGLELTEGLVSFRLRPDGVVDLAEASWKFADGTVRTRGEFDPGAEEQSLVLEVAGVSLAELLAIATLEGLSGEGRVAGMLPVTLGPAGVRVREGRLAAEPGGWIRYDPGASIASMAGSAPGFELLLPALRNYHFQKLALTLDGELTGDVNLVLALSGANPEFREGQQVDLNLNVEARLSDLLATSERVYQIPERVEQQLRRFPGSGAKPAK